MVEKVAPPRWNLVKGQLISVSSNLLKDQQFFLMISALAAKMRSNQRNELEDFILTFLHYFFDLTLRAEILNKVVGFWEI